MKKTTKILGTFVAMFAFFGLVLTSCGGGSEAEKAAEDIPTDGLLGELPMLAAKYGAQLAEMREQIFSGEVSESEGKKLMAEFDKLKEEAEAKILLARNEMDGKEIPVEVAEGIPFKANGPLKIDGKGKGAFNAIGGGEFTGDIEFIADWTVVPMDKAGKAIKVGSCGVLQDEANKGWKFKAGDKLKITAFLAVGKADAKEKTAEMKRWAGLAKFVIMDKTSDAFKKLKEQFEADKNAAELEAAKKVVDGK